jgi:hypothetical protein
MCTCCVSAGCLVQRLHTGSSTTWCRGTFKPVQQATVCAHGGCQFCKAFALAPLWPENHLLEMDDGLRGAHGSSLSLHGHHTKLEGAVPLHKLGRCSAITQTGKVQCHYTNWEGAVPLHKLEGAVAPTGSACKVYTFATVEYTFATVEYTFARCQQPPHFTWATGEAAGCS